MGKHSQTTTQWSTVGFVVAVLIFTLSYSGAGFNLHFLSLSAIVLLTWAIVILSRLDFRQAHVAWGWLPTTLMLYFGWLMLAPMFSGYPYASFTKAMSLAVMPLVFLARLAEPENSQTTREWLLRSLLLIAAAIALWGIVDFVVMRERAHAAFLDANAYAAFINLFLIPIVYLYLGRADDSALNSSRVLLGITALLALAQTMSLSRGALIAFLSGLAVVLWLHRRNPLLWHRLPWLLGILGAAYICANLFAPTPPRALGALLLAPEQARLDSSIQERLLLLQSAWLMIRDSNPLVGSGLGTFKILYPAYRHPDESSAGNFVHNDYLQALQEGGVIHLAFFLLLTIIAPFWLLIKSAARKDMSSDGRIDIVPGLLVAIGCASLHAMVNFIHYVGPLVVLTGLYLAYAWESVRPRRQMSLAGVHRVHIKQRLAKFLIVLALACPVSVLAADGIIFKLFATTDALHARMSANERMRALNMALAFRPGNPMPRILIIRALLAAIERNDAPDARAALLKQAEREVSILADQAPALALARHYFPAKILALKGSQADLVNAQYHLENAVRLAPPATTMRLELVRTYGKLGQDLRAHQTIMEAKKWVRLEIDLTALDEFAKEAELRLERYPDEARYWAFIQSEIAEVRSNQKLTTLANPVE